MGGAELKSFVNEAFLIPIGFRHWVKKSKRI
jgi:hypothetical protein